MEIPPYLETQIREGKVVLLLGSGASLEASDSHGRHPPSARHLGDALSGRFLGGQYKDKSLSQISEYAISESDLHSVQAQIEQLFKEFEPTPAHMLLSTFRWWGLATTNYDLLIEKAYNGNKSTTQMPVPFIGNGDRVEDRMRDPKSIMLLKLHGCITRISNPKYPLIITPDQYIQM